jgi:hypothetical protein
MRPLGAGDILRVWERGEGQCPVEQALLILGVAEPELTRSDLAALSVGERDARLLALREATFGPTVRGLERCPECAQRVEVTLRVGDLRTMSEAGDASAVAELTAGVVRLHFRPATSADLLAVVGCADANGARQRLLEACVLEASRDGELVGAGELPADVVDQLAAQMAQSDPGAEIWLDLDCPGCGGSWRVLFDIAAFLWTELAAHAKRLAHEVHVLASAYGWLEVEILALSTRRRRLYLELAGA